MLRASRPHDWISCCSHPFRVKPNLLLSEVSRQLKTKHFTGKGDYNAVDLLLQSFQSKIKESLREARRQAWNQEYQADPRSERYKNARKTNVGGRKALQENAQIKAEMQRRIYEEDVDEEAELQELQEEWLEEIKETRADFKGQGVQLEDIEQDQQARQELANMTQFV